MKLRCPACGAEYSLNEATQAADLLALDKAAAAFGDDWPLVAEYLACFQGKLVLKAAKQLRLAREVYQMWKTGNFSLGGVWYRIGREEFREALRTTCNQVASGLTNHNYLKKVLVAAASMTSQREERELREKEAGLRMAGRDACPTVPPGEGEQDPAYRAEILRLGRALRQAKTPEAREEAKAAFEAFMKERGIDVQ